MQNHTASSRRVPAMMGGTVDLALVDRDSHRDGRGYPLSVLSSRMGSGTEPRWLVATVGVLLGDLFCFLSWLSLTSGSSPQSGSVRR
jgi:hypothetical protein